MQYLAISANPVRRRTECAIVGVFENKVMPEITAAMDEATGGAIRALLDAGDVSGRAGETHLLVDPKGTAARRLLIVGLGKRGDFSLKAYRKALGTAVSQLARTRVTDCIWTLSHEPVGGLDGYYLGRHTVETAAEALYRFDELKSKPAAPKPRLRKLTMCLAGRGEANQATLGIEHGRGIAAGVGLARDLGNRPANVCTPSHLASEARALAKKHKSLEVQVLGEAELKRLGMNAFLSVTSGSDEPARLIVIHYRGAAKSVAPVALVGKGITFDTGGISLKPPPAMDEMKWDMGGAAAVIGTMASIAEIGPEINVVAVVPTCENMPSGRATRPGDIVKTMSGKTVEILNTDAEGRLILCDALTYARRFKPSVVLDVATLTGACVIALGDQYTGVFTPSDTLATALVDAGVRAADAGWRMPVNDEYAESLKSNFADFANVGSRDGGASIAAAFLAKFTDGLEWAHLDIAGVAWKSGKAKGGTGRPVPMLTDYLLARA